MLWIWRFLMGYLTIKIYGGNGEQILNRAAANDIKIWNLCYKNGCIYGNISAQNFLRLYTVRHGIKCKIKIIKKYGFVFHLKKHINRIGFIIGIAVFFAILIFLSNFVWIINVEGNHNISTQEIIATCKKIGIYEGVLKGKINNRYDAQRLQLLQEGVAWCSLNVEGCVLTVNLSESKVSDKTERQTPSNLKALIEGKIKRIDVTSGNVSIKVGDTISKGDLLVSGIIQNMSSTFFVHSSGEVIAETKRIFSSEGEFIQSVERKTGERITHYTLDFFGQRLPLYLGNVKKSHNYYCKVNRLTLFKKRIPINIACERYDITERTTITYDKATLEEILYNDIKKQVDSFNFIKASEGKRETVYTDKGILLKIIYNCEENIAVQDEILLSKEN